MRLDEVGADDSKGFRMKRCPVSTRPNGPEAGFALVSVLWVLAILSVVAAMTLAQLRGAARMDNGAERLVASEALFDAALDRAVLATIDRRIDRRWPYDGRPVEFQFDGRSVVVSIQDEFGKIDLNAAPVDLLTGLFHASGLSDDQAQRLANAVADWREADDLQRGDSDERADRGAPPSRYRPRHGAFQSVAELKLVPGMTDALFDSVAPALTVYSRRPSIDRSTAPLQALMALPGMSAQAAQAAIAERRRDGGAVAGLPLAQLVGRSFMIRMRVDSTSGRAESVFVVRLTADPDRPYWILYRD